MHKYFVMLCQITYLLGICKENHIRMRLIRIIFVRWELWRTQTGKKWEKTSREIITKQCKFTPHNQNESKVERRIQDVKHKTTIVLQRSFAPLVFWCYTMIFVVDCLNHIAKKPLGWRTSSEVLNGDTANISPFRFKFW